MKPRTSMKIDHGKYTLLLETKKAENIPRFIPVPFHLNKIIYESIITLKKGKKTLFEIHYIITIRKSYMFDPELKPIKKNIMIFIREILMRIMRQYDFEFFYQHISYYIRAFSMYTGSDESIRDLGFIRVKKDVFTYDLYDWGEFIGELKFNVVEKEYIEIEVYLDNEKIDTITVSDFDRVEFFVAKDPRIRVAIESYKESGKIDKESFIEFLSAKYARILSESM